MAELTKVFKFDERDLNANRYDQLSERQMKAKHNQVVDDNRESYIARYNMMFAVFGVGSIPVIGIVWYAFQINLPALIFVILFPVLFAIVTSLIMTMLDDKPRGMRKTKGKQKKQYYSVHRIQGSIRRVTFKRKSGEVAYEIHIGADRKFTVTRDQWEALNDGDEYTVYYANGRILSLEKITNDAMISSYS